MDIRGCTRGGRRRARSPSAPVPMRRSPWRAAQRETGAAAGGTAGARSILVVAAPTGCARRDTPCLPTQGRLCSSHLGHRRGGLRRRHPLRGAQQRRPCRPPTRNTSAPDGASTYYNLVSDQFTGLNALVVPGTLLILGLLLGGKLRGASDPLSKCAFPGYVGRYLAEPPFWVRADGGQSGNRGVAACGLPTETGAPKAWLAWASRASARRRPPGIPAHARRLPDVSVELHRHQNARASSSRTPTGGETNMARLGGRCPSGKRLIAA
jgi:hypothetical protein